MGPASEGRLNPSLHPTPIGAWSWKALRSAHRVRSPMLPAAQRSTADVARLDV